MVMHAAAKSSNDSGEEYCTAPAIETDNFVEEQPQNYPVQSIQQAHYAISVHLANWIRVRRTSGTVVSIQHPIRPYAKSHF